MATNFRTVKPLPFQGGNQGYTQEPDGTFAMDVAVIGAAGDATASFSKQPPLAKTDRSITASTVSQQAAAASAIRNRLFIKNNDAAISVFVNLGAVATTGIGSIEVAPKGIFELSGTNQALNVIAASGAPTVTIWEF